MSRNNYSDFTAIYTALQAAHSLHNQFMTKMRELQQKATAQTPFHSDSISEIKHMEQDIDAIYDEVEQMCNSPADMTILLDFIKGRQQERMSLIREIMESQITEIASHDQMATEAKDFIDYVRSLDCPECRDGGVCGDQEVFYIAANYNKPSAASNQ